MKTGILKIIREVSVADGHLTLLVFRSKDGPHLATAETHLINKAFKDAFGHKDLAVGQNFAYGVDPKGMLIAFEPIAM